MPWSTISAVAASKAFRSSIAAGEVVGLTGLIGSGYDEIPYLICTAPSRPHRGFLDIGRSRGSALEMTPQGQPSRAVSC